MQYKEGKRYSTREGEILTLVLRRYSGVMERKRFRTLGIWRILVFPPLILCSLMAKETLAEEPQMDPNQSNTGEWKAYFERGVKDAKSGGDPEKFLKIYPALKEHLSSLSAEVALKNPKHFADLQTLDALHLDFLYWQSQRAVQKKWPKTKVESILTSMEKLGSSFEDRLEILKYLGKQGEYLRVLKSVLESWERFPEKMRRPRPFPPQITYSSAWGREECYDALAILDLAFKGNWKPEAEKWRAIALPLSKAFVSMGLVRYGKDVLDLNPEEDQGSELQKMKEQIEKLLQASEESPSDGSDLY